MQRLKIPYLNSLLGVCYDNLWYCNDLEQHGHCQSNPYATLRECPISCGVNCSKYSILLYGQLHKRARLVKSCAVIAYPCGQDGGILPLGTTRRVPQEKFPQKPHNTFFDQACLVKMARYWPFLASLWTSTSDNNNKKRTWSIIHSLLTSHQVNNP